MSLNFKETDEPTSEDKPSPAPILHQPGELRKTNPKIFIVALSVAALAGLIFLGYRSDFIKKFRSRGENIQKVEERNQSLPVEQSDQHVTDTATIVARASQEKIIESAQPGVRVKQPDSITTTKPSSSITNERVTISGGQNNGKFTIYIGRHKNKDTADEEATRWKDAGYEVFVSEEDGWFRVSIGRFERMEDAEELAEKLSDSFEAGYKIGTIKE